MDSGVASLEAESPPANTARRHLQLALVTARENLAEARTLVTALSPATLESGTLGDTVRRVTDTTAAHTRIRASAEVTGTARQLPTGIEVAGEVGSGPEAVALSRGSAYDVILMDLRMPGGDGVTATEQILAGDPDARVLVLTTYETDADILRAVAAGATGYLLKEATPAELADAVRAAARGETVLAPSVAGRLMTHMRRPPRESLSARETEIMTEVARGRTNAEIGRTLFISEATVKTHLLRAFGKLGVSGRTAAVTTAIERGLLPSPGQ